MSVEGWLLVEEMGLGLPGCDELEVGLEDLVDVGAEGLGICVIEVVCVEGLEQRKSVKGERVDCEAEVLC